MIAINQQMADFACKYSLGERHHLPVSAAAALLRRIARVYFLHLSASLCRFAREDSEKATPRRVSNSSREMVVLNHPAHVQIFDANHLEIGHQLLGFAVV
jgi:hypothetical protein